MGFARNTKQSQYFQTIARHFFCYRGAPFFLSSQDLDLIARWERMKIPLRTVLEGMRNAFEKPPSRQRDKSKIFSLAFCQHQVLRAFEQYKERRVGKEELFPEKEEKRKKAKDEVEAFLKAIPPRMNSLKDVYSRALVVLSGENPDEEALERLEEEIENLLLENSTDKEVDEVRRKTRKEHGFTSEEEFSSIWRMKLVKHLRERYKIPYISLFYY